MNEGESRNAQFQTGYMDHASFFGKLMAAIYKADNENRAKLALGFPEECESVTRWQREDGYSKKLLAAFNNREAIGATIEE